MKRVLELVEVRDRIAYLPSHLRAMAATIRLPGGRRRMLEVTGDVPTELAAGEKPSSEPVLPAAAVMGSVVQLGGQKFKVVGVRVKT